jgi:queuosine precursor transporter
LRLAVLTGLYVGVVSETVDNSVGAYLRDRIHDAWRVVATNAISVPLDSVVFLFVAFGSLDFIKGQIFVKYVATLIVGVPLVVVLRRYVRPR